MERWILGEFLKQRTFERLAAEFLWHCDDAVFVSDYDVGVATVYDIVYIAQTEVKVRAVI